MRRVAYNLVGLLILGLLFDVRLAWALDPQLRITQYIHDSWGTKDGPPEAAIRAIAQTDHGYSEFCFFILAIHHQGSGDALPCHICKSSQPQSPPLECFNSEQVFLKGPVPSRPIARLSRQAVSP